MKLLTIIIIIGTLGLATFVVLRRRRPELAERVEEAVQEAAGHVSEERPGEIAGKLRDKAKNLVG
jgi:hypothetical protein